MRLSAMRQIRATVIDHLEDECKSTVAIHLGIETEGSARTGMATSGSGRDTRGQLGNEDE